MANLCDTNITFYSLDKRELEELLSNIKEVYNLNPGNKSRGWLGLYQKRYTPYVDNTYGNNDYVSSIYDLNSKNNYWCFEIVTKTAWEPKVDLWHEILKNHYPNIKLAYISQESESLFFVKSDTTGLFYPETYFIDICYPDKDTVVYDNLSVTSKLDLYDYLDKVIPFKYDKSKNIVDLEEEICEKLENYDDECFVHLARYIDVDLERII